MRTKNRPKGGEEGVALVVTMIIVAVMAMVAVAFMQGAGTDRSSSRSFVAYYQARLAADAGVQCAVQSVRRTLCFGGNSTNTNSAFGYHDAVTVWQNIGGADTNEATVLYVRAKSGNTNQGARPGEFGPDIQILARPLVSGGQFVPLSSIGTAMPFKPNDPNLMREMVNLNATNALSPDPWIGYRSAPVAGAPVTAARWVYVSRDGGPTNANNPPIARYAYWVEDESFKANLNVLTNGVRGMNTGTSPQQGTIDGALGASANLSTFTNRTTAMLRDRATLGAGGFTDRGSAALALGLQGVTNAAEFRFLTTVNSAGLDLSRGGFKRVNINALTNADKRAGLDRIIAAITNTNAAPFFGQRFYRLSNDAAGINSTNAVSANHAAIYLNKIAANVYDYLDDDDQPTVISNNSSFSLVTGRPTNGVLPLGLGTFGTNPIAAMGVENVPRLQEYAIHLRVRSMRWTNSDPDSFGFVFNTNEGAVNPIIANYEVWLDHYFEFWNPGTRDYTNSRDAFLKIFDQPAWGPNPDNTTSPNLVTGPPRGGGSIVTDNRTTADIPLIDTFTGDPVVFPAGEVTVVTTAPFNDPDYGMTINTGDNPADFLVVTPNPFGLASLRVNPTDRIFKGTTSSIRTQRYSYTAAATNGGPDFGYDRLFEVQMRYGRDGGSPAGDYASGVLIGNDQGIIESHVGLPINATGGLGTPLEELRFSAIVTNSYSRNDLDHVGGNILNGNADNVRGGGLRGNANNGVSTAATKPNATEGDPRSLLEQMEINIYSGGTNDTRFYQTLGPGANGGFFGTSTFGRPNANYVRPANWTDYSSISSGASNAPLFVRNGAMQTIGELGHITDPARPYITSRTVPTLARGGGRTLRVGQSELTTNSGGTNIGWYDGNQTSASRTWTSWRLADIFTTIGAVTIPGLINPNGALRDGGAALRAALHGLTYLPSPEGVGLPPLNDFRINGILSEVARRMTNAATAGLPSGSLNPFWERGEISELPIFNTGNIPTTMSNKFDRGREELVRRSIEMITTRGSIFTVYVIGQALQAGSQTTNVLGSFRLKQTLEISPQYFAPADAFNDSFPLTGPRFPRRFFAPTNYTVRVLATSYD